jgi:hypothetical protein
MSGFWYIFAELAAEVFFSALALVCWSWSVGFVLGRLPEKLESAVRSQLLVLLALSQLSGAPASLR